MPGKLPLPEHAREQLIHVMPFDQIWKLGDLAANYNYTIFPQLPDTSNDFATAVVTGKRINN